MSVVKVDLTELEKDLRGIVHKRLNEILGDMDIKAWIDTRVKKYIKDSLDQKIESKVYKFLEESQIAVPRKHYYDEKITINDYILKIIHEVAVNRATKLLEGLIIKLE